MSSDGANLGIGAEDALKVILGGEEEQEQAKMTPAGMVQHLTSSDINDCTTYDGTCRYVGKLILAYLMEHPEHATASASPDFTWEETRRAEGDDGVEHQGPDGKPVWYYRSGVDLYEEVKKFAVAIHPDNYEMALSGMTGFQWGWAVNAAKYALDLPPVPNPAIMTINTP